MDQTNEGAPEEFEGANNLSSVWDMAEESVSAIEAKLEAQKPADEEAEDEEEELEEEESLDEDDDGDDEDGDEEDDSDVSEEDEEDDESEEVTAATTFKAKTGSGDEIEIPGDAVLRIKANGKFRRVTIEDLKNNYAGQVAWDEKIRAANSLKKKMEEQELKDAQLVALAKESLEHSKKGDIGPAIEALGEIMGLEPGELFNNYVNAFNVFFGELLDRDEAGQAAYLAQKRADAVQYRANRTLSQAKAMESARKLTSELQTFQQKYSVEDEELESAYGAVLKKYDGDKKQVTVKEVTELTLNRRILNNIVDAADELEVELSEEDQISLWKMVKSVDEDGTKIPAHEYVNIVKESLEGDAAAQLKRRMSKSKKKPKGKKKPRKPKGKTYKTEDTFEGKTLDDLWGNDF